MPESLVVEETLPALDRRILRSRRMIRDAYAQLVEERGLNSFTVSDLMDRADLNRSTFYSHFADLNSLLMHFEQEIIDELTAIKPRILAVSLDELLAFSLTGQPPTVTIYVFDTLREHGSLLRVLLGEHGDIGFHTQLRDTVCTDLVRSVLAEKYTKSPSALVEYYIAYYASALLGLIQRWLKEGMIEDSETIARIMLSVMFLKPGDSILLLGEKQ